MKRWALLFPLFLVSYEITSLLANDAYLPALPILQQQLHLTPIQGQLTLSLFFLGAGLGQLLLGPVSDHWGRKPVLTAGVVVFILASIGCAISTHLTTLLFARFIQGATLATITVAGYAYIIAEYPTKKAMLTMGWMGSLLILIPALGPIIGVGVLHLLGSWRFIFTGLACVALFAGIGITLSMPTIRPTKAAFPWRATAQNYRLLLCNKPFLFRVISFSCFATVFYVWIAAAPELITVKLGLGIRTYIWAQVAVFGSYAIGNTVLLRQLMKRYSPQQLYPIGVVIGSITIILAFTLSLLFHNLWVTVIPLMLMGLGLSLCQWTSVPMITALSSCPMGATMAMLCTFFNLIPAAATWLIGHTGFTLTDVTGLMAVLGCLGYGFSRLAHQRVKLIAQENG
jgi:MFS family permease